MSVFTETGGFGVSAPFNEEIFTVWVITGWWGKQFKEVLRWEWFIMLFVGFMQEAVLELPVWDLNVIAVGSVPPETGCSDEKRPNFTKGINMFQRPFSSLITYNLHHVWGNFFGILFDIKTVLKGHYGH